MLSLQVVQGGEYVSPGNLLQVLSSKLASYGVLRAPWLEETRRPGGNLVHVGHIDMLAHHGFSGVEAAVTEGVPIANACTVQVDSVNTNIHELKGCAGFACLLAL
eukprot:3508777-Pleurochrysis_carterae.AAC.1